MAEQEIVTRMNTQLMMAASYGMTYEKLFSVIQQTGAAQEASAADTTPPTETDPVIDALIEWPEEASQVETPMTEADAAWIAEYHADALNNDHKENEQ